MAKADSTKPGNKKQSATGKIGRDKRSYLKTYYQENRDRLLAQSKEYREKNKERKKATDKAYREANKEQLSAKKKLYREENKAAISERRKKKYRENSEEIKAKARERRLRDPEAYRKQHNASQKKWRAQNKDRVRAIYRRHMNKKRREDVIFNLKCLCRERIAHALRKTSTRKSKRTIDLLGCSAAELAAHLESMFLPGMTWGNRGINGWHIDHIIPLAKFDLRDTEQQAVAFHYTNLQPLWAKDNRMKGDSVGGQIFFGFAYADRIADMSKAKPKKRRKDGRRHDAD